MSARELEWERRFWRWLEVRGTTRERITLLCDESGVSSTGYRLTPATPAVRRVVTVHGAGNDALFGWVGLFKQLLDRGAEILTFDLPGHGRYAKDAFSPGAARAILLAAITESFRKRVSLPTHAIGVSLGGSVLLGALPELRDTLASAAIVVAPLRIELSLASFVGELRPRNFALVLREREHYGWSGLVPSFGSFKRDIYPLHLARPAPPGMFGYVSILNDYLAEMQLDRAAVDVRTPTLLVYGDRDRIVPADQGRSLAGRIPGAALEVIPGSHLSTPLERAALRPLTRWLEEHERQAPR
jgi:pyruvate dehydrogenase E2 component (dihydrolipoamide acetyltransferase)